MQADGMDFNIDCYYVKGRDLQNHWRNVFTGYTEYEGSMNGVYQSGRSFETALNSRSVYDYVVLEQTSGYAGIDDATFPYIEYLENLIKTKYPACQVCYNTLWPYSADYTGSVFTSFYGGSRATMHDMRTATADFIEEETDIRIINTNDIIYNLADTNNLSLYTQESDTNYYRLNNIGKAAVQAKIFYDLTHQKPSASSLTSVYSGLTSAQANTILGYLD